MKVKDKGKQSADTLEEEIKAREERINQLSLMDDVFFTEAFREDSPDARAVVQELLSQVLGRNDLQIETMESQKMEKIDKNRGIRMDLLVTDPEGTRFNIEIQRASSGMQAERIDYYMANHTMHSLKEKEQYGQLRDRYLILLCDYDIGLLDQEQYEDIHFLGAMDLKAGKHIIGLNGPLLRQNPSRKGQIFRDFYETDPEKFHFPFTQRLTTNTKEKKKEELMIATERFVLDARKQVEREYQAQLLEKNEQLVEAAAALLKSGMTLDQVRGFFPKMPDDQLAEAQRRAQEQPEHTQNQAGLS